MLPLVLSLALLQLLQSQGFLPNSWSSNFLIHPKKVNWTESARFCKEERFQLAKIKSSEIMRMKDVVDEIAYHRDNKMLKNENLPIRFWISSPKENCTVLSKSRDELDRHMNKRSTGDNKRSTCHFCNYLSYNEQPEGPGKETKGTLEINREKCDVKMLSICMKV